MGVSTVVADTEMRSDRERAVERILDAAEIEFSESGFDGTSVRSIVRRAGVANGSLHYHFKTKEELFRRVLERRSKQINADRMQRLEGCQAGEGRLPILEQVLFAYIAPMVNPALGDADIRLRYARLRARVIAEHGSHRYSIVGTIAERTDQRYLDTIAGGLSHLPRDELQLRFLIMWSALNTLSVGILGTTMSRYTRTRDEHLLTTFQKMIPKLVMQFARLFREPYPLESDHLLENLEAAMTAGDPEE